jgi:hypothetical protein
MVFSGDLDIAKSLLWGAWGMISFIILIVYLRWVGPLEDQGKETPREMPKRQIGHD